MIILNFFWQSIIEFIPSVGTFFSQIDLFYKALVGSLDDALHYFNGEHYFEEGFLKGNTIYFILFQEL